MLHRSEQQSYSSATEALRKRLDPGSKTVAAQEFRHTLQRSSESVSDFIRRLEKTFQIAYGQDNLSTATREALLYGQLYEGLSYEIMLCPAVSGSQGYRELSTAAKGEERRLAALKQRQQYSKATNPALTSQSRQSKPMKTRQRKQEVSSGSSATPDTRECYICSKIGHFANKCPQRQQESKGRPTTPAKTKQVHSRNRSRRKKGATQDPAPEELLLSSSEDEQPTQVNTVRIMDQGSVPQCVKVQIQGVPAYGLIDSGADITIIGGSLFKKVAAVARLRKRDFMKADRVPRTYDQQPFRLDGRMDLDVEFGNRRMTTPVYIKMDAHDQLLLSEGVCRQLGIIQYHPDVETWRGGRRKSLRRDMETHQPTQIEEGSATLEEGAAADHAREAKVPTVRVNLCNLLDSCPIRARLWRCPLMVWGPVNLMCICWSQENSTVGSKWTPHYSASLLMEMC